MLTVFNDECKDGGSDYCGIYRNGGRLPEKSG